MARTLADYDRALFGGAVVDVPRLAALSFHGIPDGGELRALCWQVLVGHLPPDRREWPASQAATRRAYADIVASVAQGNDDPEAAQRLRAQIRADTERTQPDISLFRGRCGDGDSRCSTLTSSHIAPGIASHTALDAACDTRRALDDKIAAALADPDDHTDDLARCIARAVQRPAPGGAWLLDPPRTHADALARILYVYARFNRGVGYAQGMNDVLAPIYYVLATARAACEAHAFHVLVRALSGAHLEMFMTTMDARPPAPAPAPGARRSSEVRPDPRREAGGLQRILRHWWEDYVRPTDTPLWARLDALGLRPEHFALRWMLVAGAREFALPDVLVLWDALMANRARLAAAAAAVPRSSLPRETARILGLQPRPDAYTAVRTTAGRLRCEVRVPAGMSGDDDDSTNLGLLFDVFTAVLLALRPRLMRLPFDGCLALLQRLPRDAAGFDSRRLVDDALRLRSRRSAWRAVRACHAVLAAVPRARTAPGSAAALAALLSPAAVTIDAGADAAAPAAAVSRVFGQLAASLVGLGLGGVPVTQVDCLLLAIPRRLHRASPSAQAPRVDVVEVTAFNTRTLVATVRLLGSCCALRPTLASAQVPHTRIAQHDVLVCPAQAKRCAPLPLPLPLARIGRAPRRKQSDSADSTSSSGTVADGEAMPAL